MKKLFYLFLITAFFSSCNTESLQEKLDDATGSVAQEEVSERSTTTNPLYNDLMLPTKDGVFRGVSFNTSREKVYDIETARSTVSIYKDETDDEFVITTDMGKEVLDFADVTYNFDEMGLYAIKVESFCTSLEKATEVFDMIVEKYSKEFGEPTVAEDGFTEFEAYDESSKSNYIIAVKNIDDVEESFGMYMYFDLK